MDHQNRRETRDRLRCAGMIEYRNATWTCIALSVIGDRRGIRITDEEAARLCRACKAARAGGATTTEQDEQDRRE